MSSSDLAVAEKVLAENLAEAGGSVAVQAIAIMLMALYERHGDSFSVEGASEALDDLSRKAQRIKGELQAAKIAASNS